ncbi:MAG: S-methyl-5'-thioadenosine phosphorylase [Chloroflexota bacterium]|nr:S-methyl-5'-thioadenosine phosphorylase [Chloroflexota bacterium]
MLGIIGGTGLYAIPDLQTAEHVEISTPFGPPSDRVLTGVLGTIPLAFIARHGEGHRWSPSNVPYRANIYALKRLGVTHVLSVSAVGSLRADLPPLHILVPDQIIDRTMGRPRTFFDDEIVAHVGLADPFCPNWREHLAKLAAETGATVARDGTYVCIEGPQFSTRAESQLYRSWGASVIGMTAMPEARLAREAGLCYATLAMITDFDVWHNDHADVSVEVVGANLAANAATGLAVLRGLAEQGLTERNCTCAHALRDAVVTSPSAWPAESRRRVGLFLEAIVQDHKD